MRSADGTARISLIPCAKGIYVERAYLVPGTAQVVQSMAFAEEQSFLRWCEANELKFDDPLLYKQLRRIGCELLSRDSGATTLLEITSTADYAARCNVVTERFQAAPDQAAALELFRDVTERMGAEVAAFVSFVRDDESFESYRFLLACDPLWCLEYERIAWYGNDPWLAYALNRSEPVRGSDITATTTRQRDVVQLAERFGFRSAVDRTGAIERWPFPARTAVSG